MSLSAEQKAPITEGSLFHRTRFRSRAVAVEPGMWRLFGEYRDKSRYIVHPAEQNDFAHPSVKPLAVVSKMVTLGTQPGETIIDPFAGSGTTGRAAKDLGRKAVLIEREERYCEIAARRMAQEVLPLNL